MYKNQKVLAVITARGGSKGLPGKNIRNLAGKPLIAWSIEQAQNSKIIDHCIISTDCPDIAHVAKQWEGNIPFMRPKQLGTDEATTMDVLHHVMSNVYEHYDYIVLLQPTSPLRTFDDIDGCIRKCIDTNTPACVSVCKVDKSPMWMFRMNNDKGELSPFSSGENIPSRRQDTEQLWSLNGAVYVAQWEWLKNNDSFISNKTVGYAMTSAHSIDIDTELDFKIVESLIKD
ncbi:acylneuraminate cytidylyltransferase family protein [Terasakiella sp. SH-1]|uniref:acylneuraminate cytidylyltransferase family protein n=1 Tax=Terasakiella sp. SH-1 TaxID=2560057 RepID=UPI0010744203|nr:acylneuraminate cytidylyltransferase family protein [Terasakiella sp. SH-1]